jgi:5,10-methylenetetrahydromethanopterin reductase
MAIRKRSYAVLASRLARFGGGDDPVQALVELESLGLSRVWLPHLFGPDPLVLFAAAAARTSSICFGSAVAPTWPRHPLVLMQEALAVQAISGGRLTLGIGVSDPPTIEGALGIAWQDPIGHLADYLAVCIQARTGTVDFDGKHYQVHAQLAGLPSNRLPIVCSGLNPKAIDVAARWADGLITLLAPASYLYSVIAPRVEAARASRDFSLISCVPVAVTADLAAARLAAEETFAPFWGYAGYSSMLRAAGNPSPADVAVIGKEQAVDEALAAYFDAGVDEVVAVPFPVRQDPGTIERTLQHIADTARP